MKKHLNRIAVDLCTPTAERRPTTADDEEWDDDEEYDGEEDE